MSIREELSAALVELEENSGSETFEYFGKTFLCIPNRPASTSVYGIGPVVENSSLILKVRMDLFHPVRSADDAIRTADEEDAQLNSGPLADDFSIPPQVGKMLIYRQKEYQIADVDPVHSAGVYSITCENPHR